MRFTTFNTDGFEALSPKDKGGRPRTFTLPERREVKKIAKSKPAEYGHHDQVMPTSS
ncbi:helix-turn-helix domain-containing protein [Streptomyces mirabilis]